MDSQKTNSRCGYVAIVGAPNAGKSTLLNRILGQKVAITSPKPQTTRTRVLGVHTIEDPAGPAQAIFLDTPGIHQASSPLNRGMVQTAMDTLGEVDAVIWVVDALRPRPAEEEMVLKRLAEVGAASLLAINKVDRAPKPELLPLIDRFAKRHDFAALVPISALTGNGVDALLAEAVKLLPEGEPLFPADALTDQPERVLAAELVREKVMRLTAEEVPYGAAVTVSEFKERPEKGLVYIKASIHVAKESHKGIVIGAKGSRLKRIGELAREDIEALLGAKVFLDLHVRVDERWDHDPEWLRRLGVTT